jgi:hypothetical protein
MSDFVTPEGRLSFPALFEPKAPVKGAEPKYSATILIPKDGHGVKEWIASLQQGVKDAVAAKWPNPENRPARLRLAIKDGDTAEFETGSSAGKLKCEKYPEMQGCWCIQASSKNKPTILDIAGNPVFDKERVKAGYWVRMSFNLFAYDNVNVGVSCGLNNLLVVRPDDVFGGKTDAKSDFADLIDPSAKVEAAPTSAPAVEEGDIGDMFA